MRDERLHLLWYLCTQYVGDIRRWRDFRGCCCRVDVQCCGHRHLYVLDERLQPTSMSYLVGHQRRSCRFTELRSTQRCVFSAVQL